MKEYIDNLNLADIHTFSYGDKEIFIIPTPNDKPVKIVYENDGCEICKEMQIELKKRKTNELDVEIYKCGNCDREFFV